MTFRHYSVCHFTCHNARWHCSSTDNRIRRYARIIDATGWNSLHSGQYRESVAGGDRGPDYGIHTKCERWLHLHGEKIKNTWRRLVAESIIICVDRTLRWVNLNWSGELNKNKNIYKSALSSSQGNVHCLPFAAHFSTRFSGGQCAQTRFKNKLTRTRWQLCGKCDSVSQSVYHNTITDALNSAASSSAGDWLVEWEDCAITLEPRLSLYSIIEWLPSATDAAVKVPVFRL